MRPALSGSERASVHTIAVIVGCFAVFGLATHEPSTMSYALTVVAAGAALLALRREPLPPSICRAFPLLVAAHLAGGLIHIGDDVLYNTSFLLPAFEYDHLVHGSAVALATIAAWHVLVPDDLRSLAHRHALVLCLLAGLGLGAINETIEFLATLAHGGSHVGGYDNTGWDLVSNTVGALVGARLIGTKAVQCAPIAASC